MRPRLFAAENLRDGKFRLTEKELQ